MTMQGWFLILAFVAILVATAKPMGLWLFALYEGRRTPLHLLLGGIDPGGGIEAALDPAKEQGWRRYAMHMLDRKSVV